MVDSLYEISRVLLLCLGFGSANLIGKAAITGGVVLGRAHTRFSAVVQLMFVRVQVAKSANLGSWNKQFMLLLSAPTVQLQSIITLNIS